MTAVTTLAAAKINWTLEVLGRRPDGYHEVRTILQTIDLVDTVRVRPAETLELTFFGRCQALASLPIERNVAYHAAALLRAKTGHAGGAHIEIEKRIPVGAGLGGGSSDAAAVLRALVALWELKLSPMEMASLAAGLGSDVPFFLRGGTVLAQGRGEIVTGLPDPPPLPLLVAFPPGYALADKTAAMYALLRDEHFTDGSATEALAGRLRAGGQPRPEDLVNIFGAVAGEAILSVREAMAAGRRAGVTLHLAGAGPGLFCLLAEQRAPEAIRALVAAGCEVLAVSTLPSTAATGLRLASDQSGRSET